MSVETRGFGRMSDGREASLVVLSNGAGMRVGVSQVGACLQSVLVPDGRGNLIDVLLGRDGAPGYENNPSLLGAIVGRCANRIAGGTFDLGGTTFHLARNEGENSNHSGPHMWFERLWTIASGPDQTADGGATVTMGLLSRTGDQGFPGAVNVRVTYTLWANNRLTVHYEAEPSATTIINLTCHAYWNLNGHASGSVLGHALQLEAERYTPADEHHIPTGRHTVRLQGRKDPGPRRHTGGRGVRHQLRPAQRRVRGARGDAGGRPDGHHDGRPHRCPGAPGLHRQVVGRHREGRRALSPV
jgi:aldose 1-epimerase